MKYVETQLCKEEINTLINYIEQYAIKSKRSSVDAVSKDFYRVISKQIIFFKYILNAYPKTYFIKVIISDFLSLILNDIKSEKRYYYLNQRSIIENYLRLILKDEQYSDRITSQSFIDLKAKNHSNLPIEEYNKIMNEYKISCSYIHGGDYLKEHLVSNFEECLEIETKISKRQRKSQIAQFIDLVNILSKLFLLNNVEVIDNSFHRNKATLKYLMGKQYISIFHQIK
ncbi:hypothetical protein [Priestia aryabhattai]|uniref:hypothetical protein n=1 Tax=Priestia aryabhattai TaxID=412384 RepID=UPI001C8EB192|nr:hypothetical protein [Priestia aryabhattai]MBX9997295.1 hypothetical protein [Priestia aryabhattai]